MSEKVCEVKNLTYIYPKSDKGVKDISLYVNKGSIVGLLGESGCGKSTLAKCISGQIIPQSGEIVCKKIGYIFQDNYASLNPAKRVGWLLKETTKYGNPEKFSEYEKSPYLLGFLGVFITCRSSFYTFSPIHMDKVHFFQIFSY